MFPALKTIDAEVKRQASRLTAATLPSVSYSSHVLAVWKIQQPEVSYQRTDAGSRRGKTPKREGFFGSYMTTGLFLRRFAGVRESGKSRITVWCFDTPKSCMSFPPEHPGTGAFMIGCKSLSGN
jgi:hypothetical protein